VTHFRTASLSPSTDIAQNGQEEGQVAGSGTTAATAAAAAGEQQHHQQQQQQQ
jgi:hypothetical protein